MELFFLAVRCKRLPRGPPEHKNRPLRSRQGVKIGVFAWEVLRISGNDFVDSKTASEALRGAILTHFGSPAGVILNITSYIFFFSRPRFLTQIWVKKEAPQSTPKSVKTVARGHHKMSMGWRSSPSVVFCKSGVFSWEVCHFSTS